MYRVCMILHVKKHPSCKVSAGSKRFTSRAASVRWRTMTPPMMPKRMAKVTGPTISCRTLETGSLLGLSRVFHGYCVEFDCMVFSLMSPILIYGLYKNMKFQFGITSCFIPEILSDNSCCWFLGFPAGSTDLAVSVGDEFEELDPQDYSG